MENRSDSGHRDTRNISRNVEHLQLTEEERKVLRDCRLNSMMRGIPAGIISALITKFVVSSVSFTGGLLFGVASYRKTCLEEIMKLENSSLADQVREYYKRAGLEYNIPVPQKKDSGFSDVPASDYNYDFEAGSELTKEDDIPHSSKSITDDENRWPGPTDWRGEKREEAKPSSFEELRKQNRQSWQQDQYPVRSTRTMRGQRREQSSDEQAPSPPNDKEEQGSTGIIRRNIYGDPIE